MHNYSNNNSNKCVTNTSNWLNISVVLLVWLFFRCLPLYTFYVSQLQPLLPQEKSIWTESERGRKKCKKKTKKKLLWNSVLFLALTWQSKSGVHVHKPFQRNNENITKWNYLKNSERPCTYTCFKRKLKVEAEIIANSSALPSRTANENERKNAKEKKKKKNWIIRTENVHRSGRRRYRRCRRRWLQLLHKTSAV